MNSSNVRCSVERSKEDFRLCTLISKFPLFCFEYLYLSCGLTMSPAVTVMNFQSNTN